MMHHNIALRHRLLVEKSTNLRMFFASFYQVTGFLLCCMIKSIAMQQETGRRARSMNQTTGSKDKPWIFRTYAGHSTAEESNRLYRANLARGQTGLSVAFDLPTQTGYDPDHVLARGEVGKVGVSIAHLGDMRLLFRDIPVADMNTSMTINATAAWLLALYVAVADEQGASRHLLQGTTQNDIIKEYLSRGTYVFPPAPSMRLIRDTILFTTRDLPKWNPTNVCSYHLQEAGATPVQELAFALATAVAVLDEVKASGLVTGDAFGEIVGRISFFVNAGMRFVTELCKMRAFAELWDEITRTRYGISEERHRRFRYGVQVNSLGLTEQQPENNVYRILIEMLAVVLSKRARARAVQLPAWNEALGLPRAWDQQWSLRMQQVMAYETDLLEYGDIFDGSTEIERKVHELKEAARTELARIETLGGAVVAVEHGIMKRALVESNARRINGIERGEQVVVGVNRWGDSEPSPLTAGEGSVLTVPDHVETEAIARIRDWRATRDPLAVETALQALEDAAKDDSNIMPASIACAKAGVTTGEWGETLRRIFGRYRAPTGVSVETRTDPANEEVKLMIADLGTLLGEPPRLLVGKPGLDGHSNGAEQIALRARDVGFDVTYDGIRLTPEEIVAQAIASKTHLIGLSILSGSHVPLVRDVMARLRNAGLAHIPVVVGGIIPAEDENILRNIGVRAVYTPKDYAMDAIMRDIAQVIKRAYSA
jgi:(2R)-ethylmalonyl-CoA mutase